MNRGALVAALLASGTALGESDPPADQSYRAVSYDHDGRSLGEIPSRSSRAASSCLGGLLPSGGSERYTIVGVEVRRGDDPPMAVFVHTASGPRGQRVIGVDRR